MHWLWIALAAVAWLFLPNATSGALIGFFGDSWTTVIAASSAWPLVWCLRVGVFSRDVLAARAANLNPSRARFAGWPPLLVVYGIEFATALATALPIACIVHWVRAAT